MTTYWTRVAFVMAISAAPGLSTPVAARALQNRPRALPAPGPLAERGVTPAEIQRLFEAYVAMQAQQALQLTDDQYPPFLVRVKALQEVRRRGQVDRLRILQDLRRLTRDTSADQGQMTLHLKALDDVDARVVEASRSAMEQIDEVLDVRQRAKFRLFEEQMERRKVDLLVRARQATRSKPAF